MKFQLIFLFLLELLGAEIIKPIAEIHNRDNNTPYTSQHVILVDSTSGNTTMWTQMHESVAYSAIADAVQIVNRGYAPSGVLNVHQTDGDVSLWVKDYTVYNNQIPPANGGARYPTSVAGARAYISFPTLDAGPAFGYAVAQYQEGGWYSSVWADPIDLGPGNLGVHKVIGKELPNGNILCIGVTVTNSVIYRTWDSTLTQLIGSGTIDEHAGYWGFDINGGIAYIFYVDEAWTTPSTVYYQTTTDGVTWSGEQIYDMVWPNPYTNNIIWWTQVALTDSGNPLLVFNNVNDDDLSYPYYSKVYVSYAKGQPCVEVSSTFGAPDTECFYPTIATGGNMAAVLYAMPRNNLPDSLVWMDFYVVGSTDNGKTWSQPENTTQFLTHRPGLQQLAKRLDTLRHRVYYIYNADLITDHDPFWHIAWDPDGVDPFLIYFDYALMPGIEEEKHLHAVQSQSLHISCYPNPFRDNTKITYFVPSFLLNKPQCPTMKIYNATGILVKTFVCSTAQSSLHFIWNGTDNNGIELPGGVYFISLDVENHRTQEKILLIR